jgi:hypothetical protein
MRIEFPPNLFSRPHVRSEDRYFVVLKGTCYRGTGPVFDPAKAVAVPEGVSSSTPLARSIGMVRKTKSDPPGHRHWSKLDRLGIRERVPLRSS